MTEVSKSLPSCLPQISSHCYLPENNHFINNLFRKKGGWGKPLLGNYISLGTDFRGSKNPPASQANQKNPSHPVPFLTSHNAMGLIWFCIWRLISHLHHRPCQHSSWPGCLGWNLLPQSTPHRSTRHWGQRAVQGSGQNSH